MTSRLSSSPRKRLYSSRKKNLIKEWNKRLNVRKNAEPPRGIPSRFPAELEVQPIVVSPVCSNPAIQSSIRGATLSMPSSQEGTPPELPTPSDDESSAEVKRSYTSFEDYDWEVPFSSPRRDAFTHGTGNHGYIPLKDWERLFLRKSPTPFPTWNADRTPYQGTPVQGSLPTFFGSADTLGVYSSFMSLPEDWSFPNHTCVLRNTYQMIARAGGTVASEGEGYAARVGRLMLTSCVGHNIAPPSPFVFRAYGPRHLNIKFAELLANPKPLVISSIESYRDLKGAISLLNRYAVLLSDPQARRHLLPITSYVGKNAESSTSVSQAEGIANFLEGLYSHWKSASAMLSEVKIPRGDPITLESKVDSFVSLILNIWGLSCILGLIKDNRDLNIFVQSFKKKLEADIDTHPTSVRAAGKTAMGIDLFAQPDFNFARYLVSMSFIIKLGAQQKKKRWTNDMAQWLGFSFSSIHDGWFPHFYYKEDGSFRPDLVRKFEEEVSKQAALLAKSQALSTQTAKTDASSTSSSNDKPSGKKSNQRPSVASAASSSSSSSTSSTPAPSSSSPDPVNAVSSATSSEPAKKKQTLDQDKLYSFKDRKSFFAYLQEKGFNPDQYTGVCWTCGSLEHDARRCTETPRKISYAPRQYRERQN